MTATQLAIQPSPEVRGFLGRRHGLFVGGEWVEPSGEETLAVEDPAVGEVVCTVGAATPRDVDRAVRAAAEAFAYDSPWRRMTAADRSRLIHRLADLVAEHADELAELEAIDAGKPRVTAREFDVEYAIRHFRYFAGWPTKIEGETIPVAVPDMMVHTRKEPVGVVGQIIPWNFPLLMVAWKLAPALAAGCTAVLKPAEQTPLSALRVCELIQEVGLPSGVVNVVPGTGPVAGDALSRHPLVDKVAFTGSTAVGKSIAALAACDVRRVTLELGGKSPNVVFADSPLEDTVPGAFAASFANAGQSCSAGSRLFVEQSCLDSVIDGLARKAGAVRLGHGLDPETDMGPLISSIQLDRVAGFLDDALDSGAEIAAGGDVHPAGTPPAGHFMTPTILVNVEDTMRVARDEIFGPVLSVLPFDSIEEVARRANDTSYGLAAGVWTRDIKKANRLADVLRVGSVYINTYGESDAAVPFGGFQQSGYGREMGHAGLDSYLEVKSIWTSLAD